MAAPDELDRIAPRSPAEVEDARARRKLLGQDLERAGELTRSLRCIEPSPFVERCIVRADLVEVGLHRCSVALALRPRLAAPHRASILTDCKPARRPEPAFTWSSSSG